MIYPHGISIDYAFNEAMAGNDEPVVTLLQYVSWAFSEEGNQMAPVLNISTDQDWALEMFGDIAAIPDLVLDAQGEGSLDLAVGLEKEISEVGKQLIFDQNTLEM